MCGIQITKNFILNKIKHRGIEHFSSQDENWNTHFSSLPINSSGTKLKQPLRNNKTKICFNGEIFNYGELGNYNSDLELIKDIFSSSSWLKKYKEMSKKFDGFWSITVQEKEDLFFMTDPYGKKQLYYSNLGVCSEIKPILNKNKLNLINKIGGYNTDFEGVYRAMPGVIYKFNSNLNLPTVYSKIVKPNYCNQDYNLIELIDKSIKNRVSNIRMGKVALLFSGGLDSSILASRMVKMGIEFKAFSISNGEDEAVKKISKKLGFKVEWIKYDESKISEAVKCYEKSYDLGSLLPNYLLFEKCKKEGFEVVLTGDGADELFGGYNRNLISDTREFDVETELPFYHLERIDRTSMAHTVECRNPFLSSDLYNYSKKLNWEQRKNKNQLRKNFLEINNIIGEDNKKPLRWKPKKEDNLKLIQETFKQIFK